MSQDENVVIRFVLPQGKNETTCSEDLAYAYEQAQDAGLRPSWTQHHTVLDLNFTKLDVFVMDPFEGLAFQTVSQSKATIVGPRCLLSCLEGKDPVPELPYPMFTAAMKGLIVTSTGFEREEKTRLQRLVERMAGIYSNAFHDGVTHLVANVVRSSKYSVAVDKEIPIMTEEWVLQIWSKSQNDMVTAGDRQFSRYACPALMGLTISVSNMSVKDKDLLRKSIESHGGTYSRSLDMTSTNVLIISNPEGDKYNYAKKWKIPILNSNWIFDSIEKGYCLQTESYMVEKRSCSTPTKEEVSRLTEVSLCSTIMGPGGDETATVQIDETVENPGSITVIGKAPTESWLQTLEISCVAKAGPFLDGCRIFISGFDDTQQDHLRRVIQLGGATKLSHLIPSVTHVLLKSIEQLPKALRDPPMSHIYQVSIQWVVESMHLGRPAPESDFTPQKPMIGLPPLFSEENDHEEEEEDEVTRFDGQNDDTISSCNDNNNNEETNKFLTDKKFALVGLDEEKEQELSEWIEEEGGEIVSGDFSGTLDYLVLPVNGCDAHNFTALHEVNHFWMNECLTKGEFVAMEYFYKSYSIDLELKPLEGVVVCVSGFTSHEREFLGVLAEALGGICQEVFNKKEKGDKKKSTHLISLHSEGTKYDAAIRWKLPVVSKEWLMSCLEQMNWLSEKPFLLGESDVYSPDKPLPPGSDVEKETEKHIKLNALKEITNSQFLTPIRSKSLKQVDTMLETPSLDIEKMRPKKFELSPSLSVKWNPPPDSQPSPSSYKPLPSSSCKQCHSDDADNEKGDGFHCSKFNLPEEPYGAFLGDDSPSPHNRKFWKYHLEQVQSSRPSERERNEILQEIEDIKCKQIKEKSPDPLLQLSNVLRDFTERLRISSDHEQTSFDELMEDKLNRIGMSWKHVGKKVKLLKDGSPPDENTIYNLPLDGVTVYVTKKCLSQLDKIYETIDRLGGVTVPSYNAESVTHVVFSSAKVNDITKEFRLARSDGKHVICPEWVFECEAQRRLLNPQEFPHTLNARNSTMNETLLGSIITHSTTKKKKREENAAKVEPCEDETRLEEFKMPLDLNSSKVSSEGNYDSESSIPQTQAVEEEEEQTEMKEKHNPEIHGPELESQDPMVTNIDFQSMEIPENMTEAALMASEEELSCRFMISGYPDDVKAAFAKLVDSVDNNRISFSHVSGYDPSATHIITPKFSRSEKMLCAIASGKMFLHGSYLDNCLEEMKILSPLEDYEWGRSEKAFLDSLEADSFERQLANASYRWRNIIDERKRGAFDGFVAIIHSTPKRREAFQRLIESGGGLVITPNLPYSDPGNATHCLAEPHKLPKSKVDYDALAARGVAVVEAIFINEFLIHDPPPSVESFLIEEFKPLWGK